jgi:hypothetical protein
MFGGEIERKMKESVVDKSDSVASAALIAGLKLFHRQIASESIRRWIGEITSSIQSRSAMVQFHVGSIAFRCVSFDDI